MRRFSSISLCIIFCFSLVLVLSMGCAARPFFRPAGKPVGSVKEISFDNDVIHIETSPSGRDFNGKLTGNDLKFKGEWNQYSGMLKLRIKE